MNLENIPLLKRVALIIFPLTAYKLTTIAIKLNKNIISAKRFMLGFILLFSLDCFTIFISLNVCLNNLEVLICRSRVFIRIPKRFNNFNKISTMSISNRLIPSTILPEIRKRRIIKNETAMLIIISYSPVLIIYFLNY